MGIGHPGDSAEERTGAAARGQMVGQGFVFKMRDSAAYLPSDMNN